MADALSLDAPLPAQPAADAPSTRDLTLALFQQGLSAPSIAARRGLKRSTVERHLVQAVLDGLLPREVVLDPAHEPAILQVLGGLGHAPLSLVKAFLPAGVRYPELHLLVAEQQRDGQVPRPQDDRVAWLLVSADHPDPDTLDVIAGYLEADRPEVRAIAAHAAARIGTETASRVLAARLANETDPPVREALIRALGLLGGPSACGTLDDLAARGDRPTRSLARRMLGRCRAREARRERSGQARRAHGG